MSIIQPTPDRKPFYASTYEVSLSSLVTGWPLGKVESARISADRGWSPRWEAHVTIAADFDHAVYGSDYLKLTVRRMDGAALPLSDWTARIGGKVTQYTLLGAGALRPEKITDALGGAGGGGDDWATTPETMSIDLYISEVRRRLAHGTTDLTLHSGEVVLQDIRRMALTDRTITGCTTVSDLVEYVISQADPASSVEIVGMGLADNSLLYGEIVWKAGDSAWDMLAPWLTASEYPLYSIKHHHYRLVGPLGENEPITATFDVNWSTAFDITQRPPGKTVARLRRYSFADTGKTSIDGAGTQGTVRGIVDQYTVGSTIPYASNWSGSTGVGSWRDRDYSAAVVTRAAQLWPRPGLSCNLRGTRPDGTMLLGRIESVTWTFPEGLEEIIIDRLTDGDSISL